MTKRLLYFFLLFLLPIDWFSITGQLLSEAGGKPAILLMYLITLTVLLKTSRILPIEKEIIITLLALISLSFFSMFINLFFGWSDFDSFKKPHIQFIAHTLFLISFFICIIGLKKFFQKKESSSINNILFLVALFHFSFFILEFFGLLNDSEGFLSFFRIDAGIIDRPSGLMSEPSYFGTASALLGFPLIILKGSYNYLRKIVGLSMIIFSFLISAKTIIMVLLFQLAFLFYYKNNKLSLKHKVSLLIAFLVVLTFISTTKVLDVQENLSSATRLGSSHIALNVALNGYALTGVGIGQFHYFYRPEFAPEYMNFVNAEMNFGKDLEFRSSTFNFFLRTLVEIGLAGLIIIILFLKKIARIAKSNQTINSEIGFHFMSGSIGFLLTQDTYFYPPLILGISLILAEKQRLSRYP